MIKSFSKLLYILGDSKLELLYLLVASIFASVLEALGIGLIGPFLSLSMNPELIKNIALLNWLYQRLGIQSNNQFIAALGIALVILFCIKSVAYFFMKSYIYNFGYRQKARISKRLMNTYLTVPYEFFLKKNTSTIIRNILIETEKFAQQVLISSLEAAANFIIIAILIIVLAKTDIIFLAIASAIILPTFGFFYIMRKKFARWGQITSECRNEIIRIINHSLGGIKETRLIGCEQYFEEQMDEKLKKYTTAESLFNSTQIIPRIAIETILVLFLILLIVVYQLFFEQSVQQLVPVLSVFAIASIRLIPATSQFIALVSYAQGASYSMDAIYLDLLEAKQQESLPLKSSRQTKSNSSISTNFTFKNQIDLNCLTYRYPETNTPALLNISLSLQKGESIALIGKSGAGKTTLVDLILGLLEPQSGDISVDGVSVYDNLRSWQDLIGYIPQTIFLMDDTLERNIAFGVPDELIDQKRLQGAMEAAQLTDLIDHLPNGLNTVLGERGIRLSGGQRQRVGIARALYHKKEILVLDEATSALDNETESLVTEAIQALSGTLTMIIIAHRLTTVKHCDRIYSLEGGRIVKSGSYKEVVLG
ncbi:ABC transporter ATP-binding protein [Brunnivagina elsteri]|uniref:ABC transporter ATP-binding protein n=1 Tax=Brunnivagina elsteri CCALA 953 TaxID=987040 RepID=A0A2A2TI25_9CYAN|nr:ABC transporter ATP-binding protein/permease [Calothrix elsteri]PAX53380.1 ABC transporter ATP-binding protein [Calothrix elsteri CCALA 953]